jgi:hypothetical protein
MPEHRKDSVVVMMPCSLTFILQNDHKSRLWQKVSTRYVWKWDIIWNFQYNWRSHWVELTLLHSGACQFNPWKWLCYYLLPYYSNVDCQINPLLVNLRSMDAKFSSSFLLYDRISWRSLLSLQTNLVEITPISLVLSRQVDAHCAAACVSV